MSLWSRLFGSRAEPVAPPVRAATQSADGGVIITNPQQLEEYLKSGAATASGALVNDQTSMRIGAVYACVRIIAGAVANLPLDVKRRVDERTREDADDHPLWTVLRRKPNRWQTPSEFKRMLQTQVLLHGNGYAMVVRSRGRVLELLPIPSRRVQVKQNDDLSLEYTVTRRNGAQATFAQSDMFHLRGMTFDGVCGVSPVTYAREAIGLAMQTEKHGARLFKNGTSIGLVLEHPNTLSGEARDNLKSSLEAYRGAENAGKSLILEEGMKATDKVGMTSEDAQFLETRKFQRSDIAMFFGVPPHMIGDTEKSTSWGTGIEQQSIGFVTYTMEDWFTMWEEAVNRDLVGDAEPKIYTRFNRSALLRGDLKTRWEAHVKALQWGVRSPNEVRALEDENPREGGDEYYPPPNTAGGDKPVDNAQSKEPTDDNQEAA